MSVDFIYRTSESLSYDEILRVQAHCSREFNVYGRFSSKESKHAHFYPVDELPEFNLPQIEIIEISTEGYLPTDTHENILFEVFSAGRQIAEIGYLSLNCSFEESKSEAKKGASDMVTVKLATGRRFFSFYSNGSRVSTDKDYARAFFKKTISKANLPIKIVEQGQDYFLERTSPGEMKPVNDILGRNPYWFECEVMNWSEEQLVHSMELFLEVAARRKFEYSWRAGRNRAGIATLDPDLSKKIFEMVRASKLPAEDYFIDLEFRMEDISGIESLKRICGQKDKVYSRLCSFDLPPKNYADVNVLTTFKGHQLELVLRLPENLQEIESKIGLKFIEA